MFFSTSRYKNNAKNSPHTGYGGQRGKFGGRNDWLESNRLHYYCPISVHCKYTPFFKNNKKTFPHSGVSALLHNHLTPPSGGARRRGR